MRFTVFTLICCALALGPAVSAQPVYPAKPVRLVVGFPPGGGNDLIARVVAAKLQDAWSQAVVVENRPGADGVIATEFVAKAPADGYTLLVGATGHMTALPALRTSLPYDTVRDFAPVALIASFPLILTVNPAINVRTVAGLVALAKSTPGKLNYGSGASAFQLAMEMFKQDAGIDVHHIPYKGGAQAVNALLVNDVQVAMVDTVPVLQHVRAGRLSALAVTSSRRSEMLRDVPTLMEAGFPDFDVTLWTGLFAPAGTPQAVTERLQRDMSSVLHAADVRERFRDLGVNAAEDSPREFAELVKRELARWAAVAKAASLQTE